MNGHTPGPWYVREAGYRTIMMVDSLYGAVCDVLDSHDPRGQANAHRIAAVPDMIEALEAVHAVNMAGGLSICKDAVAAALAKARGE